MLLVENSVLRGDVLITQPINLRAEPGASLKGTLILGGGGGGARTASLWENEDRIYWLGHSGAGRTDRHRPSYNAAVGVIEGLTISHYSENAVIIRGGRWALVGCKISASSGKRTARGSAAIIIRDG